MKCARKIGAPLFIVGTAQSPRRGSSIASVSVAGSNDRLVAACDFHRQIAFVAFVGTHTEYDPNRIPRSNSGPAPERCPGRGRLNR
jgi:hypothetical protein